MASLPSRATKPTQRGDRGATLPELIVAILLLAMFLAVVAKTVTSADRFTRTSRASVSAEASLNDALTRISRDVKANATILDTENWGAAAEPSPSTDSLWLQFETGFGAQESCVRLHYYVTDGALRQDTWAPQASSDPADAKDCPDPRAPEWTGATKTTTTLVPNLATEDANLDLFTYYRRDNTVIPAPLDRTSAKETSRINVSVAANVQGRTTPLTLSTAVAVNGLDSNGNGSDSKGPAGDPPTTSIPLPDCVQLNIRTSMDTVDPAAPVITWDTIDNVDYGTITRTATPYRAGPGFVALAQRATGSVLDNSNRFRSANSFTDEAIRGFWGVDVTYDITLLGPAGIVHCTPVTVRTPPTIEISDTFTGAGQALGKTEKYARVWAFNNSTATDWTRTGTATTTASVTNSPSAYVDTWAPDNNATLTLTPGQNDGGALYERMTNKDNWLRLAAANRQWTVDVFDHYNVSTSTRYYNVTTNTWVDYYVGTQTRTSHYEGSFDTVWWPGGKCGTGSGSGRDLYYDMNGGCDCDHTADPVSGTWSDSVNHSGETTYPSPDGNTCRGRVWHRGSLVYSNWSAPTYSHKSTCPADSTYVQYSCSNYTTSSGPSRYYITCPGPSGAPTASTRTTYTCSGALYAVTTSTSYSCPSDSDGVTNSCTVVTRPEPHNQWSVSYQKNSSGTITTLAVYTMPQDTGLNSIGFDVNGFTVKTYANGSLQATYTDAFNSLATQVGVGYVNANSPTRRTIDGLKITA